MQTTTANNQTKELGQRWSELIQTRGPRRIRQAATELGVSELELLLCADADTGSATLLDIEPIELLAELQNHGTCMLLTRNHGVVHEQTGEYGQPRGNNHAKVVINGNVDLRVFPSQWAHVVAVEKEHAGNTLKSFQFFDKSGDAVHKSYMKSEKGQAFFDKTREESAVDRAITVEPIDDAPADVADADYDAFREGWLNMKDTHQFFGLCRKHGLNRREALVQAPEGHAEQISLDHLAPVFESARDGEIPIMVFVGNRGCIQIFTGQVNKLMWRDAWFNVLDPAFNLHVNTEAIAELWIVRKPTSDGMVTSVEAFDEKGEILMYLFGARKPGVPELTEWRELVESFAG